MNKVVIAGGTGFIGKYLEKRFTELGYKVLIISRSNSTISWNESDITQALEGSDMIINLAGKSVNCRHTQQNKKLLYSSRINSTKTIGAAIKNCKNPPPLWINASAAGIYKPTKERPYSETNAEYGTDFLATLVKDWEKTFFDIKLKSTIQIALRTSVVLGKNGGALLPLIKLTRFGLGGKQSDGDQMFSWIHIEDYFRIIQYIMQQQFSSGVINCTSPTPITNNELMRQLRATYKIPLGLPAPTFAIKIGALLIGTEASLIINSSYIYPKKIIDKNFLFKYPDIKSALENLH